MKKLILIGLLVSQTTLTWAQKKHLLLPQKPGYVTLACDFHEHTIFSDGEVWPTVRLDEAERNGLDVIAITDHIEYTPHKDWTKNDLNAAYKIIHEEGDKRGILVIHGAEITRKMPPGHFNALFISDAEKLKNDDFMQQMQEAINQGAFIQWNHPGWRGQRADGVPRMDSIHHVLLDKKWIHAMEVYNDRESYPLVIDWCLKYNVTMTGNMDIHGPYESDFKDKKHPPMTLVFAASKSEKDVKEALMAGRTIVWWDDTIAGQPQLAKEVFLNSLEIGKVYFENDKSSYRFLTNKTDIPYSLIITTSGLIKPIELLVPANSSARLRLPKEAGKKLDVMVKNCLVGQGERLKVVIDLN